MKQSFLSDMSNVLLLISDHSVFSPYRPEAWPVAAHEEVQQVERRGDEGQPVQPGTARYRTRNPSSGYPKEIPVRENTGNIVKTQGILSKRREFCQYAGNFVKTQGILSKRRENTGNFVCSSCKCSDSKSKGYCDICHHFFFFPKAG